MSAETLAPTVSEPPGRWALPSLREVWRYRDLVYLLGRRDIAVRYKQTALGAAWALLQPLILAGVFSVFLGVLVDVPSDGVPYPVFALAGMTIWLFFVEAVTKAADSAVAGAQLITKVYFPRLVIPLAAAVRPAVDLAVAIVVLLVVAIAYGLEPGLPLFALPGMLALAAATALGAGLILSAAAVRFRDVAVLVPIAIQVLMFTTPVVYPLSLVPDDLQPLYALNPLVGVVEGFRWAVVPGIEFPGAVLAVSAGAAVLLLAAGLLYFARAERTFADVI